MEATTTTPRTHMQTTTTAGLRLHFSPKIFRCITLTEANLNGEMETVYGTEIFGFDIDYAETVNSL